MAEDKKEINEEELKKVDGGNISLYDLYCPNCKQRLEFDTAVCPYCGQHL